MTTKEALKEIEMRCCQARLAVDIGNNSKQKKIDFLLGELRRIEVIAKNASGE